MKKERKSLQITKTLLACGVALAPWFFLLAIPQMLLRPGFDIRRLAISSLELGDLGWIQRVNFLVTGLLAILCAVGIKRVFRGGKGEKWAPILIGMYGLGIVNDAIFAPPVGNGFPPGAPQGMPTSYGISGTLHSIGFMVAFLSLIIAMFVFARRFASLKQKGWKLYSITSGVLSPLLVFLGMSVPGAPGISFALASAVAFGWLSIVSKRLIKEVSQS